MQHNSEEFPLEVTEDCWVPPHLSQSFVACKWGSHVFHPVAPNNFKPKFVRIVMQNLNF
jgi:hypothetical protein